MTDGSVVCEDGNSGAAGIDRVAVNQYTPIEGNKTEVGFAECPDGYIASGGGFSGSPYQLKFSTSQLSGNRWMVVAYNETSYATYFMTYAMCIKLLP